MKFEKREERLGVVTAALMKRKAGTCPMDEEFALYMEGRLSGDKREAAISHFVSCRECRERLSIPLPAIEIGEGAGVMEKVRAFWKRPLVAAPAIAVVIVLLAFFLNVYLTPDLSEERFRGSDLAVVKQMELTQTLIANITGGNVEEVKREILKELPPDTKVLRIVVEDAKSIETAEEGDKINLILYSNGVLKIKPE